MKGMSRRQPITGPSNKVLSCVQTAKNTRISQTRHSCQQPHALTIRVLILEVADEADVFLHPVKGPQLQSIPYHLHRLLQQLGTDETFVTLANAGVERQQLRICPYITLLTSNKNSTRVLAESRPSNSITRSALKTYTLPSSSRPVIEGNYILMDK